MSERFGSESGVDRFVRERDCAVVNHLIYDAFGKVTSESNPTIDSLFLFTGRPFDSDTDLQNNLNRWYDARVGRWLSEDPIGLSAGDFNLYRYVFNHPVAQTDSSGLDGCGCPSPAGIKQMAVYYRNQACCEAKLKQVLADRTVGMLFACAKRKGCVSRVSCAKFDPRVDARFRPGLFWGGEIQVNQDPDAAFMKGDSAKILTHELYHSLTLCGKRGFTGWEKILNNILVTHNLTGQKAKCAWAMAEELIAYRCSGMCQEFNRCAGRAQESENVQRVCGNIWYASPVGSPLYQALSEFFAQVRNICEEVKKGCEAFKQVETVLQPS